MSALVFPPPLTNASDMPQTINPILRDRIDAFVDDLSDLIRQAALESVQEALGGVVAPARRGPGRPPKTAGRMPGPKPSAFTPKKAPKKKAGARIRRSADDLDEMAGLILDYVKGSPGNGVEAISKALRVPSKELKRPVQMLIADKKLRTEGNRRGTTYFAGAGRKATQKRAKKGRK